MVVLKKASVLLSAAALSIGLLAPVASATTVDERMERLPIQVAQTNTKVTKKDLINRMKELFPTEFSGLTEKDFYMNTGYPYPGDSTVRYELSFSKQVKEQHIYGSLIFAGADLQLEHFYYQPPETEDAFFPAKVSESEAQQIADKLVKQLGAAGYKFSSTEGVYTPSNLTQPVQYTFIYRKTEGDIPVADRYMEVTIRGDGQLISFYNSGTKTGAFTYDDASKKKDAAAVQTDIQNTVEAQLFYLLTPNYHTGGAEAQLVYRPNNQIASGVHALSGDWVTLDGLSASLPKEKDITPIAPQPLPPRQPDITEEQAEQLALSFLQTEIPGVTLTIDSINETTNYTGKQVYMIQYNYEYEGGNVGTALSIDKATGEIIEYYDIKYDLATQMKQEQKKGSFSQQAALKQAVESIKKWAPSYANEYAMPVAEAHYFEHNDSYYFSFPRIVNGLLVEGDQITVNIGAAGDLLGLSITTYSDVKWPTTKDVVAKEEATKQLKENLSLQLQYENIKNIGDAQHYSLIYRPLFKESSYGIIDAKTGKWLSGEEKAEYPAVEHPTAAVELNYLIRIGALEVDGHFNPDTAISKGEALKVLMRSLTYSYDYYPQEEAESKFFENISPADELYPLVMAAVTIGILDEADKALKTDDKLSREEVAKWAVRMLKLEAAAKHGDIYQLGYTDAAKVSSDKRGYVALAYAMGLLNAENNQANPQKEITYAELAKMTVLLANEMKENNIYH